jgi:thioredoxin reductase
MIDIAVIGSGPAGLSAGISAKLQGLYTVVITSGKHAGRLYRVEQLDNFPGMPGISGPELSGKLITHAIGMGVQIVQDVVRNIEWTGHQFHIRTLSGTQSARCVVLATGMPVHNGHIVILPNPQTSGGHIITDRQMESSIPGLFAAGDCAGTPYLSAKAVGEGQCAAYAAAAHIQFSKSSRHTPIQV